MGVIGVLGVDPALDEAVAHGEREAEVGLPLAVHVLGQLCQRDLQVAQELPPDGLGVQAIGIRLLQVFGPEGWSHARDLASSWYLPIHLDLDGYGPHALRDGYASVEAVHATLLSLAG